MWIVCFFIIFILSEWVPRRQPVVLRTEKQGFQSRWAFFLDRYAQQLNRTKITSPDKHEILLEKAELYSRVLKEAQDSHWAIIKLPAETIILYMPFRLSKDAKARAKCWSLTLRIKVDFRVKLEQSFRVMLACQLRVWLFFCLEWTKREYRKKWQHNFSDYWIVVRHSQEVVFGLYIFTTILTTNIINIFSFLDCNVNIVRDFYRKEV